jgi:lysylphosphatidylglycerol synthetase-like protein (DUF2156 family)
MDGQTSSIGYFSALLVIIAIFNFLGFLLGFPLVFAFTAACFWAAAPPLMDFANQLRIALNNGARNNTNRAGLAGLILLFIGSILSFFCVPSERARLGLVLDIIVLCVVAVFDIIGGAILANLNLTSASAQVFIVLGIFAVAIIFGSKSLLYVSLVLSTILFTILLPGAFGGSDKSKAAYVIAWLGMLFTFVWCVIVIQIIRGENDQFDDTAEHDSNKKAKNAEPAA